MRKRETKAYLRAQVGHLARERDNEKQWKVRAQEKADDLKLQLDLATDSGAEYYHLQLKDWDSGLVLQGFGAKESFPDVLGMMILGVEKLCKRTVQPGQEQKFDLTVRGM